MRYLARRFSANVILAGSVLAHGVDAQQQANI
jgi:hypothetical protein